MRRNRIVLTIVGMMVAEFLSGSFSTHVYGQEDDKAMDVSIMTLWESKYVLEGRDNLDDGGIYTFESVFEKGGFSLNAWYALGDSQNYQELNVSGGYSCNYEPFEIDVGYTRLEFFETHESDNELTADVAYSAISWLIPSLAFVYSTEAKGSFVELCLRSDISILEKRVTFSPYLLEGFDFGYASQEYDGPNNLQAGVDLTVFMSKQIGLTAYLAHTWAHEDVRREDLGNLTWVGVGAYASF